MGIPYIARGSAILVQPLWKRVRNYLAELKILSLRPRNSFPTDIHQIKVCLCVIL